MFEFGLERLSEESFRQPGISKRLEQGVETHCDSVLFGLQSHIAGGTLLTTPREHHTTKTRISIIWKHNLHLVARWQRARRIRLPYIYLSWCMILVISISSVSSWNARSAARWSSPAATQPARTTPKQPTPRSIPFSYPLILNNLACYSLQLLSFTRNNSTANRMSIRNTSETETEAENELKHCWWTAGWMAELELWLDGWWWNKKKWQGENNKKNHSNNLHKIKIHTSLRTVKNGIKMINRK